MFFTNRKKFICCKLGRLNIRKNRAVSTAQCCCRRFATPVFVAPLRHKMSERCPYCFHHPSLKRCYGPPRTVITHLVAEVLTEKQTLFITVPITVFESGEKTTFEQFYHGITSPLFEPGLITIDLESIQNVISSDALLALGYLYATSA